MASSLRLSGPNDTLLDLKETVWCVRTPIRSHEDRIRDLEKKINKLEKDKE